MCADTISFNELVVSIPMPAPIDESPPVVPSVKPPGPSKVIFLIRVETVKFDEVGVVPAPLVTPIGPVLIAGVEGTTAVI
jgi:hypothetical protein